MLLPGKAASCKTRLHSLALVHAGKHSVDARLGISLAEVLQQHKRYLHRRVGWSMGLWVWVWVSVGDIKKGSPPQTPAVQEGGRAGA